MNVFVPELMWFLMGDKDSIFSDAGILALIIYLEMHFNFKAGKHQLVLVELRIFQIVLGYIQSFPSHKTLL